MCNANLNNDLARLIGSPKIIQKDSRCNVTFALMPPGSSTEGASCASKVSKWTHFATTDCGQRSASVTQTVTIVSSPPIFNYVPPDVAISCESSIDPRYTGRCSASKYCLHHTNVNLGSATATSQCAQQAVNVVFQDSAPVLSSCGIYTISRTWYAYPAGCTTGQTNSSVIQRIVIKDQVAPYWSSFPSNYVAPFSQPYGTDLAGIPSAYDSCASGKMISSCNLTSLIDLIDRPCFNLIH